MKISVIIPVYNRKDYIRKCIDSALQQTRAELEIIIIDDGSYDGSETILDEYAEKDKRIHVYHKENEGPGVARNLGIDNANGDFLYFLDSDDYMLEGAWDYFLSTVEKYNPDLIVVKSVSTWNRESVPECNTEELVELELNAEETLKAYLCDEILSGPPHKLYRKSLFTDIRFPAMYRHEDAYIMHELFGASIKTIKSNRVCSIIVNHSDSLIHSKNYDDEFDALVVGDVLSQYIGEKYPSLLGLAETERIRRMDDLYRECCWENVCSKYKKQLDELRVKIKNNYSAMKDINPQMYRRCRNDVSFPAIVYLVTRLRRIKYEMCKG